MCVQGLPIRPLPRNDPTALGVEAFKQLVLQPTTALGFAGIAGELLEKSLHPGSYTHRTLPTNNEVSKTGAAGHLNTTQMNKQCTLER